VRAGYLEPDRAWMRSLGKFAVSGIVLAVAFWLAAQFAAVQFTHLPAFRNEATLLLLIVVGVVVYGALILTLFGRGWLRSLVRG
jgi:putative peptidoglycan lipid II flippase